MDNFKHYEYRGINACIIVKTGGHNLIKKSMFQCCGAVSFSGFIFLLLTCLSYKNGISSVDYVVIDYSVAYP